MIFSEKWYQILRYICLIALPALTTFYGVLGATLNIPYVQETLTIMVALDTLLGSLLQISTNQYNKEKDNGIRKD